MYVTSSNLIMKLMDDYLPKSLEMTSQMKRVLLIYEKTMKSTTMRKSKICSGFKARKCQRQDLNPGTTGSLLLTTTLNGSSKSGGNSHFQNHPLQLPPTYLSSNYY